jgi:hypothetical protein
MLVKRLYSIVLIALGLSSIQAMNNNLGTSPFDAFFANPQAREYLRTWLTQWLSQNTQELAGGLLKDNIDLIKVKARELLSELIDERKGQAFEWFEARRNDYSEGILGTMYELMDQALGRKSFPLTDSQLGGEFSLKQWSSACYRGNENIIQIFLNNPEYTHLLNLSFGKNKALSWAAFGYLNGEAYEGVVPEIGGFTLLVNHLRIESNFPIEAGLGRIPFDEWLLHEASYPEDSEKQARLEELKALLEGVLSQDRLTEIKEIRDRKDSQRRAQAKAAQAKREIKINKMSFLVGAGVAAAALYYVMHRNGMKSPDRSVAKEVGSTPELRITS